MRDDKLQRLEAVARMYYELDLTQAEIAKRLQVSRPFVSRLLAEAKALGIVEVRITPQGPVGVQTLQAAVADFGIRGGTLVPDGDDGETNLALGQAALSLIEELGGGCLGLGWGHVIGVMVADLEQHPASRSKVTNVTPLIGNRGVPIRSYHSNENTRIVAQQLHARAHYLHAPSMAESPHELELLTQTSHFQSVTAEWSRLDIALVNIGNYPSTPDFASGARFGTLLARRQAAGHLIAYYYDKQGEIIHSDHDYVIQIPFELLRKTPNVIGICSANVSPTALLGALRTGIFTHVVARANVMEEARYLQETAAA
ncbi:MAG: MarR family transcriptional regulator [Propionibacteriaceae bacterium]|nr:MarR family transcriptional regulator [Propionibacteriaceae bacterium]